VPKGTGRRVIIWVGGWNSYGQVDIGGMMGGEGAGGKR
jgi:hypothetical protein